MGGKVNNISRIIKNNFVFLFFLFLLSILSIIYPNYLKNYHQFVDWNTVAVLTGLLIITTAIKESSFFIKTAKRIIDKINNERNLALTLIILSAILSMFLTNDIALFIVVPLTLAFKTYLKNDLEKLIIFEAISVNVGSTLSPIGNPQNLFLWHQWNISFLAFVIKMIPLFVLLFFVLIVFGVIVFKPLKLSLRIPQNKTELNKVLFYVSILILVLFVLTVEFGLLNYALLIVFVFYLTFFKRILKKVDWLLIFLIIIMFIDFQIISKISVVSNFINQFNLNSSKTIFTLSLFSSQIISNVPASIFISKFSHNLLAIAYGVNVGGNGLVIGSLANIIALTFINKKKAWFNFHKYSLPYIIITGSLVYVFFIIN